MQQYLKFWPEAAVGTILAAAVTSLVRNVKQHNARKAQAAAMTSAEESRLVQEIAAKRRQQAEVKRRYDIVSEHEKISA